MKRVLLAVVGTVTGLVMLLSFKTHALPTPASPPAALSTAPATGTPPSSGTAPSTGTAPTTSSPSAAASPAVTSRTVTGDAVDTRYGPIQVEATVAGGRVTAVTVLQVPDGDPRDRQINGYAVPVLTSEAVAAGDAQIDMVSGATYTSEGYIQSLQSALDRAGA